MTTEHKILAAPAETAADSFPTPAAEGKLPEKNPAEMGPEEWYAHITKRADIREILSRLAK